MMYLFGFNWFWVCLEFFLLGFLLWNLFLNFFNVFLRCCLDIKFLLILINFCLEFLLILYLFLLFLFISLVFFLLVCKFMRIWSFVGMFWFGLIVCYLDVGWNIFKFFSFICLVFVVILILLFLILLLVFIRISFFRWFFKFDNKNKNFLLYII